MINIKHRVLKLKKVSCKERAHVIGYGGTCISAMLLLTAISY